MAEVDAVAVYWRPFALGQRVRGTLGKALSSRAALGSMARRTLGALVARSADEAHPEATGSWADLFRVRRILREAFGACPAEIAYYDHHLTHQLYAEAVVDWPDCLSLSIDGGGEVDATVLSLVRDGRRQDLKRIRWPNSLGHFYSAFTGYLGFRMLEGEYKMMGLAPYGEPRLKDVILDRILRLEPDGGYRLDTAICDYHRALEGASRRNWLRWSAPARARRDAERRAPGAGGQRPGGLRGGAAEPAGLGQGPGAGDRAAGDLGRLRAQRHGERAGAAGGAVPRDHRAPAPTTAAARSGRRWPIWRRSACPGPQAWRAPIWGGATPTTRSRRPSRPWA